jgi:hypothetical protein
MKFPMMVAVLVALSLVSSPAQAVGIGYSVVGAGSYGLTNVSVAGNGTKGQLGYGGGVLVDFGLAVSSVEVGALYLNRKFETTVLGTTTQSSESVLHIPAMMRFGSLLTLGLGAYLDLPLGNGAQSDYGLTAGPRLGFGPIFADARFNYGLKSSDFFGQSLHHMELLLLVGYTF